MHCKITQRKIKSDTQDGGCNVSLASQKDFLQKVADEYVPYDYITTRSYKYEKYKKKADNKLLNVKLEWVLNRFDSNRIQTNKRLVAKLDAKDAPETTELEKNLSDETSTSWIPESITVDFTLNDRQLDNDIEVTRSPYRSTEKSVLTMMLPIKPFPLRDADEERWNRFPSNRPPLYSKSEKPTGKIYYSMMHKYYQLSLK
ncbi:uncharacterized protein [Halyomorpha halys]|uniref:uncharacterized protein n=1 Tax=Halyomorpha halys TaxID=286706 RepID=UPI0006D5085E|nr:uncharacterized protein LOC106683249 [Halyomorpha halys]